MLSGRRGALVGALVAAASAMFGSSPSRSKPPIPRPHAPSTQRWIRPRRRDTKPAFDRELRNRRNKIAARSRLVNRRKAA